MMALPLIPSIILIPLIQSEMQKDVNKIFNYMKHDKKISGYKINLILLSKIGKAKIFPSDLNRNIKPILIEQFN